MALRGHEELETLFDGGDFKSCKYRLDLCISGSDSRESRKLSIQQVKKNGNFNGFRKGTVPPFVMKQIDGERRTTRVFASVLFGPAPSVSGG
jgi:FKBP-type peptidyl-prolyl cis-trans isomerase (trigger factor)